MNPTAVCTERYLSLLQDDVSALMFPFSIHIEYQMFGSYTFFHKSGMETILYMSCSILAILWKSSLKYFLCWYAVESPENSDSTLSNLLFSICITFCGIPSPCFSSLRIPWYTLDISEVVELSIQSTADWERV